jgi:hypothetical protein
MLIVPRRRVAATGWTPAQITTALWLDASDAATVERVSGAVSQWNDKSGNNRNVTQSTSGKRPIYVSAGINSLNTIRFDGIDDELISTSIGLPVGLSARSAFCVYKPNRTSGTQSNAIFGQGAATNGQMFALQFRATASGAQGDPYFAGFAADLTNGIAPTATVKQAAIVFGSGSGTLFSNGSQIASGSLSLDTTNNQILVGNSPANVEFAQADICEIIYTANAASTTARQLIEGYMAWKWGLQANLPAGHPYKSAAPTA